MLSATAAHAVRALVELAALGPKGTATGRQLSSSARIPANFLSKILASLGRAGFIHATRGNRGGYQLLRNAAEIRLSDVANVFDDLRWRERCFLSSGEPCQDSEPCTAHPGWLKCREALDRFLDETTIAALAVRGPASPRKRPKAKQRRAS